MFRRIRLLSVPRKSTTFHIALYQSYLTYVYSVVYLALRMKPYQSASSARICEYYDFDKDLQNKR